MIEQISRAALNGSELRRATQLDHEIDSNILSVKDRVNVSTTIKTTCILSLCFVSPFFVSFGRNKANYITKAMK